ncbi:MAG: sigma 54-interacting transcriptional regulator [Acidobacteria bacterium]|nr:sigma 54-interacting transcriptional regulator [Acidobacteriota bacterium]
MLSFEVRKTGGESEVRKVHRDVIHIGASSGNDLVVRARGVLGRHARISVVGEELRLEVLGTAPGSDVTVNGNPVKTVSLGAGDRIQIGEATITLLNGPPPGVARMGTPPPHRRDAFAAAAAALSGTPSAPVAPAASPARSAEPVHVKLPTPAPSRHEPRSEPPRVIVPEREAPRFSRTEAPQPEARRTPTAAGIAAPIVAPPAPASGPQAQNAPSPYAAAWTGVYERVARPVPLDEALQELISWISSSSPLHSIAIVSLREPTAGDAVAAVWKGTLPRLSARTLDELRDRHDPLDANEGGLRLRLYPIVIGEREAVRVLALPIDAVSDPFAHEFATLLAAALGFASAVRADAATPTVAPAAGTVFADRNEPLTVLAGSTLAVERLRLSLPRMAATRAPVLVIGEAGTGKTLVAELLHALSARRHRPLVRIDATGATAAGLEEELLGVGGRRRTGRLFEGDGGTLLVEEVGELPPATQALLVRLLEVRSVTLNGRNIPVDVRIVATSSRSLTRPVEEGAFRDDLYYRLAALSVHLPLLRDRREDVPALIDAFAARHGGPPAKRFDLEAMNALLQHPFPGNLRELENEVRRLAQVVGTGRVKLVDLDPRFSGEPMELAISESDDLKEIVSKVERQVIERVMRKVAGNQSKGARLLNISRGSLIAKMKEFDVKDFRYLKRQD